METLASVWARDLGDLGDPGDGRGSCQQHEPVAAWASCIVDANISVVCFDSISIRNSVCPVALTIKQKCELSNGHHEFILTFSSVIQACVLEKSHKSICYGLRASVSTQFNQSKKVREAQCVLNYSSPPGPVWTDQLSPHLQRNKQLQDTLLQREEELARLQEENNKLREFLNSSFVKNLEEKAKKLDVEGRKKLKRSLQHADNGTFQNLCSSRLLLDTQRISKRVCRNLTAEFCSQPEISAASEPNLDLWVLRTLGLKDRDTIDTSDDSSSSFTKQTQSQETIELMKSPERLQFSPILASTPVTSHYLSSMEHHTPSKHCQSPTSTLGGATATPQPPATPQMPCCRTDIAFSMSLSPSSSVKTHSFPQGQAFVRKDTQGRWNFTWVPKQEP
ncbi:geminin coiled-coil domain-containing protein 1 [Myripristis murdjan]|uniref:geminin coiled-coil domain-containing protein 1 n=1 Tax=Myripristis murdjan TaxID=586833 RepID=UPI001176077E|nr:geminin coiled-coil domain-containing protein 1 [Myripristis murdjan]